MLGLFETILDHFDCTLHEQANNKFFLRIKHGTTRIKKKWYPSHSEKKGLKNPKTSDEFMIKKKTDPYSLLDLNLENPQSNLLQ